MVVTKGGKVCRPEVAGDRIVTDNHVSEEPANSTRSMTIGTVSQRVLPIILMPMPGMLFVTRNRVPVVRKYYIRPAGAVARHEFHSERERLGDDTGSMPRRRPSVSSTVRRLLRDLGTFVWLGLTSRARLAAVPGASHEAEAARPSHASRARAAGPAARPALDPHRGPT